MINSELFNCVKEFQNGNKAVFEQIYNITNNQLFNVLYSFVKDKELSYDLMQDTYITFYSKADTIKMPQYTQKWLTVVAINKAKKYLQTKKNDILVSEGHEDIFENQYEVDEELLPQEILDSKEKQKIIKDIIDNLPLEQKTAVYLYYFNEMPLSEVAEEMGCSEGTIKSRLNYARKKIKVEVDNWEKKGTKLYSSGVPVLVLLLKSQIQEANAMSLDKANNILDNIKNSNISTSSMSNMKNVHKAISKKIISSCLAGGITSSIIAGYFIYNHKQINSSFTNNKEITTVDEKTQEETTNLSETDTVEPKNTVGEEVECDFYWAYAELGIMNVENLTVSDINIVEAFDFKEDKCIGVVLKSNVEGNSISINVNEQQIRLFYEDSIWNEESRNDDNTYEYISFKEICCENIESINVSDNNIIDATLSREGKYILIKQNGTVGKSVITVTNNKGEKVNIVIKCSQDSEGKVYFSGIDIQ